MNNHDSSGGHILVFLHESNSNTDMTGSTSGRTPLVTEETHPDLPELRGSDSAS